jgi:hypothetical protein
MRHLLPQLHRLFHSTREHLNDNHHHSWKAK